MNDLYRNLLDIKIAAALASAHASKDFKHPALVGKLRELFIKEVIRPFLPSNVGVGTGKIITNENQLSKEQDIIVFDKGIIPPIVFEQNLGLFPVESVLSVIEVKSKLTVAELKTSHINALELLALKHLPAEYDEFNNPKPYIDGSIKGLNFYLFAYESDCDSDEAARYDKVRDADHPAIRMICVAQKGCWILNTQKMNWRTVISKKEHDEIACFLSIIINSLKLISESKGTPRFGSYIIAQ